MTNGKLTVRLCALLGGSIEAYRLHLEAKAAGYSIELVKKDMPRGSKAEAKRNLAKLVGAS